MRIIRKKQLKMTIIGLSLMMIIVIIGLVYATLTSNVTVNGDAVIRNSKWKIKFKNLQSVQLTGQAEELSAPTIQNDVRIADYSVAVTNPGDTVSYTFDVENEGDYNAIIGELVVPTPSCHGTGSTALVDATNVCKNLIYELTYSDGTAVAEDDILESKDTVTMKVKLTYASNIPAAEFAKDDVSITNLGISILYEQTGNAIVNPDGTTLLV